MAAQLQPTGGGKQPSAVPPPPSSSSTLAEQWSVVVGSSQWPRLDWLPSRAPSSPSTVPVPSVPCRPSGVSPKGQNLHPTTRHLSPPPVLTTHALFLVTGFSRRFFAAALGRLPWGATCANRLVLKVRLPLAFFSIARRRPFCGIPCPVRCPLVLFRGDKEGEAKRRNRGRGVEKRRCSFGDSTWHHMLRRASLRPMQVCGSCPPRSRDRIEALRSPPAPILNDRNIAEKFRTDGCLLYLQF